MTTTLCKTLGIGMVLMALAACDDVFGLHFDWDFCKLFFEPAPQVQEPTGALPVIVFEDPSTIVVYHGSACADSNTVTEVRMRQSLQLPAYANSATVFLNGWHLRYAEADRHVTGVAAFIRSITRERNELSWEAVGALTDNSYFQRAFNFCYYYTVVGWNASRLDASINHSDGSCDPNDTSDSNFFAATNDAHTTSLSCFPSYGRPAAAAPAAVVPRGFGFAFIGDDSHLLQIAMNMDHSEGFVMGGQAYNKRVVEVTPVPATPDPAATNPPTVLSHVGDGYVSWETYGVFKDNAPRRPYAMGQLISTIAGPDVGVIQPPFSVLPYEDGGFFSTCLQEPPGPCRTGSLSTRSLTFMPSRC